VEQDFSPEPQESWQESHDGRPSHPFAVRQQSVCSNFWIAHNSFSKERHAARSFQTMGGEHGLVEQPREGAQATAHDVAQPDDKRLRSSSDSMAATGCQERRGPLDGPNIEFVKRRSIDGPPVAKSDLTQGLTTRSIEVPQERALKGEISSRKTRAADGAEIRTTARALPNVTRDPRSHELPAA
jgi:hypothetical protein